MLPICCEQCGRLYGDFIIDYENDMENIINNNDLDDNQKINARSLLLDKYVIKNICCRTNLMTYYQTIKYIK